MGRTRRGARRRLRRIGLPPFGWMPLGLAFLLSSGVQVEEPGQVPKEGRWVGIIVHGWRLGRISVKDLGSDLTRADLSRVPTTTQIETSALHDPGLKRRILITRSAHARRGRPSAAGRRRRC